MSDAAKVEVLPPLILSVALAVGFASVPVYGSCDRRCNRDDPTDAATNAKPMGTATLPTGSSATSRSPPTEARCASRTGN